MTLWARPKPGPWFVEGGLAAAVRALNWSMSARLMPRMAEPPTRSNSRRVTPSQVSFPARPGITNIAGVPWLVVESEAWRVGVGGHWKLYPLSRGSVNQFRRGWGGNLFASTAV